MTLFFPAQHCRRVTALASRVTGEPLMTLLCALAKATAQSVTMRASLVQASIGNYTLRLVEFTRLPPHPLPCPLQSCPSR